MAKEVIRREMGKGRKERRKAGGSGEGRMLQEVKRKGAGSLRSFGSVILYRKNE